MILTPEEVERVKSHCPCGAPVALEEMTFREGQISKDDGRGNPVPLPMRVIESYLASRYHHKVTMRFFCSAACSLTWHELFWRPFRQHLGAAA